MSELVLFIPPGRPWGTPNMSPFCSKLETYLRMVELPYKTEAASFGKAPKGKIPYASIDGKLLGDSQHIIEQLERTAKQPLDAGLTPQQAAIGRAVRRMLEEATYFTGVHLRWATDEGFAHVRSELAKLLPAPVRLLLPVIRRKAVKSVVSQGTGRHSLDEICALAIADFQACADLLGDQPYLLGDQPHVCDATLYAFAESVLRFPNHSPIKAAVSRMEKLVAYCDRIRARWWADLDQAA
jgi:glutathione S-transferase